MARSRSPRRHGGDLDPDQIQRMIEERQDCRKAREYDKADDIREELRSMGVHVDDNEGTWRGPDGMSGNVKVGGGGGNQRRDGDWDCPSCGKMNFAYRESCFSCGMARDGSGDRYDDRRGGGKGGAMPGYGARRYDEPRYDDRRYEPPRYDPRSDAPRYEPQRYDDRRFDDHRQFNGAPPPPPPRFDGPPPRYDLPRYDERDFGPRGYDNRRFDDRRYDDRRFDDRRFDDRRFDDRRYDDRHFDDRRYDDRRFYDRRVSFAGRRGDSRDRRPRGDSRAVRRYR